MREDDNFTVEDSENFSNNKVSTYEELVINHLNKCCSEGSKEMSAGGMQYKLLGGNLVKIPVPNQKEVFINHIKILETLIYPKITETSDFQLLGELDHEIYLMRKKARKDVKDSWSKDKTNQYYDKMESILVEIHQDKMLLLTKILKKLNFNEETTFNDL